MKCCMTEAALAAEMTRKQTHLNDKILRKLFVCFYMYHIKKNAIVNMVTRRGPGFLQPSRRGIGWRSGGVKRSEQRNGEGAVQ